jgi:hypothetical protein
VASVKVHRCAAAILGCFHVLVEGALLPPPPAAPEYGPYPLLCTSTVPLELLQQGLLGDYPRALLHEVY